MPVLSRYVTSLVYQSAVRAVFLANTVQHKDAFREAALMRSAWYQT